MLEGHDAGCGFRAERAVEPSGQISKLAQVDLQFVDLERRRIVAVFGEVESGLLVASHGHL